MLLKEKPLKVICIVTDYHTARTVHLLWFVKLKTKKVYMSLLHVVGHNQDYKGLNLMVVFTEYS